MNIEHIGDVTADDRARLEHAKQFIMGYPDYAKCISAVEAFAVRYFADEEKFAEEFRTTTGKEPRSGQKGCITTECGRVVMLLLRSQYIERTFFHECVHHAANFPALRGGVSGEHDGGAAQRSFGIFLKWLSERSCPVYVVATANNIHALPVEFTRKGRFDEVFGVHLPTHDERADIFGIHLKLRKRDPEQLDLDRPAKQSDGYTGADIKEVVQMGLKLAFHAEEELAIEHLRAAIPEIRPLVKTDPEAVTAMTRWLDTHTKPAGNQTPAHTQNGKLRKRRVTV